MLKIKALPCMTATSFEPFLFGDYLWPASSTSSSFAAWKQCAKPLRSGLAAARGS